MKIAVIGSRNLAIDNLEGIIPDTVTEIVSGGARGIDSCAKQYAMEHLIKYTEFLPEYNRFGKAAPLKRNIQIIEYADVVIAIWDGKSRGTKYVIEQCKRAGKEVTVYFGACANTNHIKKKSAF